MTPFKSAASALSLSLVLSACSAPDTTAPAPDVVVEASVPASAPTLTELWVLEGFDAPESVIEAADGTTLYVSNAGGEGSAKDGNGVISKIGINGTMIDRDWVVGTDAMPLDGPKGMALVGGTLAVTDIDHVVMIDVAAGEITARIPIEGSIFLNDAAVGPGGTVFVSDSRTARIYQIENGLPTLWFENALLAGLNGLHNDGERLLVTTMTFGKLLAIDWETKAITELARGMDNADGIGLRADGSYIISSWPGQLWHAIEGEVATLIQDTTGDTPILMNDILLSGDTLITPNWLPGTVRGYGVK